MRPIKFRGKTKRNFPDIEGNVVFPEGTWIKGGIVFDTARVWIDTIYYGQILVDKNTIGQYTGLHDKNGKEIYEGDIVIIEIFNYEEPEWSGEFKVTYSEDLASFIFDDLEDISNFKTMNTINSYYHYEIEVIGNIYENSNLLKD